MLARLPPRLVTRVSRFLLRAVTVRHVIVVRSPAITRFQTAAAPLHGRAVPVRRPLRADAFVRTSPIRDRLHDGSDALAAGALRTDRHERRSDRHVTAVHAHEARRGRSRAVPPEL